MFCDETLELIESMAAGELEPDERITAHLASCAGCAATLSEARRLEQLLQTRPIPKPPNQFTTRLMGRIRRDRWRREQFLDTGFNVAVGLAAIGLAIVLWLVLSRSGMGDLSREAFGVLNTAAVNVARRMAPSLPLYGGAAALVGMALGIWWWAEKDAALED